jgi:hypothetical protein
MIENTTQVKAVAAKKRKYGPVTVVLQCLPLLLAGGCTANAVTNEQTYWSTCILLIPALLWGLGYLYLGRGGRFLAAFVLGPIYIFVTLYVNEVTGAYFDFEHFSVDYASVDVLQRANRFMLQEAVMIAAAVLILAVDAWRLAEDHNLRLRHAKGAREGAAE